MATTTITAATTAKTAWTTPATTSRANLPALHDLLIATAAQQHTLHADVVSTAASAYLDHLVALPLASLVHEPILIAAETSTVESELVNLCYREYPTFLSVHKCSAAVSSAFDDFQSSLDGLLDSVPSLEDECRAFSRRTVALSTVRHRSVLVQEHQEKLLNLLELPRLMETCVRNGYYHEAMELAAHARSLQERYPDTRLVADVNIEVDGVQQLMLAQLFALLREPIKLQNSIKTIGFLRRLKLLDEPSLSLAFLTGRLLNFQNQLVQIEKDRVEPTRYVRTYIDLFRENVYEIMSQYCAVFDDFDLLVSFAGQCVMDLSLLVASYIPKIAHDSASMSSILIQLGYCSLSFARIGLDFSSLIPAPFEETVLLTYAASVSTAAQGLASALSSASTSRGSPMDSMVAPGDKASISTPFDSKDDAFLQRLVAIPSLARFVNEHLTALNRLRLLAPTRLAPKLSQILSASLVASTKSIHTFVVEALASSTPFEEGFSRPGHSRMPSSPRSHIIRRSTDTQLPPAALAVKRRESQHFCVWLATAWQAVAEHVAKSLAVGVYDDQDWRLSKELETALGDLGQWASGLAEQIGATNGSIPSEQNGAASASGSREHRTILESNNEGAPLQSDALVAEPLPVPNVPDPATPLKSSLAANSASEPARVEPEVDPGAPDVFGDPRQRVGGTSGKDPQRDSTARLAPNNAVEREPPPADDLVEDTAPTEPSLQSNQERKPSVVEAMFSPGPEIGHVADADMEAALNAVAPTAKEALGTVTPGPSEDVQEQMSGDELRRQGPSAEPSAEAEAEAEASSNPETTAQSDSDSPTLVKDAVATVDNVGPTQSGSSSPGHKVDVLPVPGAVTTDAIRKTPLPPDTAEPLDETTNTATPGEGEEADGEGEGANGAESADDAGKETGADAGPGPNGGQKKKKKKKKRK